MRRLYAFALVPVFALAACTAATSASPTTTEPAATTSAPASSPAATSTVSAPTGKTLTGDGYTMTLPKGWEDATEAFKKMELQVDVGGKNSEDRADKFTDNVNVIVQTSQEMPLDTLRTAIQQQLEQVGSTNIEFKANTTLDGAEAINVWSHTKNSAEDAKTIQYAAFHGGKLYVLTVSSNLSESKAGALAQQILAGWKWAAAN